MRLAPVIASLAAGIVVAATPGVANAAVAKNDPKDAQKTIDVRRVIVAQRTNSIRVLTKVRDLKKTPYTRRMVFLDSVPTSEGDSGPGTILELRTSPKGKLYTVVWKVDDTGSSTPVKCAGAKITASYKKDKILYTLPYSCLYSTGSKVRVSAFFVRFAKSDWITGDPYYGFDDANYVDDITSNIVVNR